MNYNNMSVFGKIRRWFENDRFFVTRRVRRLRIRFKIGLSATIFLVGWSLAPIWLPLVADPLVADYAGMVTEAVVVEGWFALDIRKAEETSRIYNGQRVYVVVNENDEDIYGFGLDRLGQSKTNLFRAGIDTSKAFMVLIPERSKSPGYTAFNADRVRERLLQDGIRSFTLVTDSFHSQRSSLIYNRVFKGTGIVLDCYPSPQEFDRTNWWRYSSGIQYLVREYLKLCYYLFRGFN